MSGFEYKPLQLKWCNGGKRLVTDGVKQLVLWPFDKKGPEGREPTTRDYHEKAICAISVASNGKSLATGCRQGRIAVWKTSQDTVPRASALLDSRVEQLQWSPKKGAKQLAAISRHGSLYLFDGAKLI